nr:MAG: capsid protein [Cressdnaviricota sp.]
MKFSPSFIPYHGSTSAPPTRRKGHSSPTSNSIHTAKRMRTDQKARGRTKSRGSESVKAKAADVNYSGGIKKGKNWNFQLKAGAQARANKLFRKIGGIGKFITNSQTAFVSATGLQNFAYLESMTTTVLNGVMAAARNQLQWMVSASTANTSYTDTKVFINHCFAEYYITNQSIHPSMIEVYPYYYRKDCADSMLQLFGTDYAQDTVNQLPQTNQVSTNHFKQVGYTPFDNSVLCHWVKIKGVKKFWLQGGETCVWKSLCKFNKYWDNNPTLQSATTLGYGGWTSGILVRFHACPVMDSAAPTSTSSFGKGQISINKVEKIMYRGAISTTKNHIDLQDNVGGISVLEDFPDEVAGQILKATVGFVAGAVTPS